MMPDLPRLSYPCGYAYRGASGDHEVALKSIPDTNRRNGFAAIDTMKCGRNWNARGRGRPYARKAQSTDDAGGFV